MAVTAVPQQNGADHRPEQRDGLTVDQLSQLVGMSARNIRSHQARKLLPPPLRRGRIALYNQSHVRRLKTITALQRQGFNLVSIEAILGARNTDPSAPALTSTLERLVDSDPSLMAALSRHNVVARGEDGTLQLARPQVIRTALKLHQIGLDNAHALRVLAEVLEVVQRTSADLTRAAGQRILALTPVGGPRQREDLERDTAALTQGIVDLLSEAFRVAVENCSESIVDSMTRRH